MKVELNKAENDKTLVTADMMNNLDIGVISEGYDTGTLVMMVMSQANPIRILVNLSNPSLTNGSGWSWVPGKHRGPVFSIQLLQKGDNVTITPYDENS